MQHPRKRVQPKLDFISLPVHQMKRRVKKTKRSLNDSFTHTYFLSCAMHRLRA